LTAEEASVSSATNGSRASCGIPVAAKENAREQADGSEKHGSPGTPGESESVSANMGIHTISFEGVTGLDESGSHKGSSDGEEHKANEGDQARESRCETAARGEERCEEPKDVENEAEQVEDPAKAPHVVVVSAGSMLGVVANKSRWRTSATSNPSVAKWQIWDWFSAVRVARPANIEIGPL